MLNGKTILTTGGTGSFRKQCCREILTRFIISIDDGASFVFQSLHDMQGAAIFIPKLPSCLKLPLRKERASPPLVHPRNSRLSDLA
jgi:FlaA1/EpsC-like NDP-sugar epimerase